MDTNQFTQLLTVLTRQVQAQYRIADALERLADLASQQGDDIDEDSPSVDLAGRKIGGP